MGIKPREGGLFAPGAFSVLALPHSGSPGRTGSPARGERWTRVPLPASSAVTIRTWALVEAIWFVDRAETLPAVASLQNLPLDILERRFHYRRPGLWVLSVRILRRPDDAILVPTPEQAGCKSWVTLSEPLSTRGVVPVLPDDEFAAAKDRAAGFLGRGLTPELGEETS
ncbi:MAG: DUF1802 family protein [Isosphaeraceae bacterium]